MGITTRLYLVLGDGSLLRVPQRVLQGPISGEMPCPTVPVLVGKVDDVVIQNQGGRLAAEKRVGAALRVEISI